MLFFVVLGSRTLYFPDQRIDKPALQRLVE
jgi:hypothetical protein